MIDPRGGPEPDRQAEADRRHAREDERRNARGSRYRDELARDAPALLASPTHDNETARQVNERVQRLAA